MKEKIYFGWWVTLGASCTLFVCGGIGFASLPVFLKFVATDMNWGRDSLSNAGAISALAAGFAAPFVGYIIDRHSVRSVMLPGAMLISISYLLLGRINSIPQLYILYLAAGIGMAATTILPSQTLISRWFEQKRGRAMGIVTSAGAAGGMFWMPVSNYLIEARGWREAYAILGVCVAVIALPFIWITIRNSPQAVGLVVDGLSHFPEDAGTQNEEAYTGKGKVTDYTVRDALRTRSYWLIFIAIFMVAFAGSGFGLHIVAFLSDAGLSSGRATATWVLTIGVSVGGRFLFGYLSEKYQKRYFASGANLFRALSILLLVLFTFESVPRNTAVLQLVIIYGLALGANNVLNPLLVSETFGVNAFGRLMGSFGIPFTIGMAGGQYAVGHLYESLKGYSMGFSVSVVAFICAGVAISFARPYLLLDRRAERHTGN